MRLIRDARVYEIEPEPDAPGRVAIVEALERIAREDDAPTPWQLQARREAVDDGLG